MSDDPDELAVGLLELAERDIPPADGRFEAGLRQALRWEQRRRRVQRRRLLTATCLTAALVALVAALALPSCVRHLPLPVGDELRRLDAQANDLQARLAAQAAVGAQLRHQLAAQAVLSGRGRPHRLAGQRAAATRRRARVTAAKSWSSGWPWVRATASSGASATRPTEASPLASISSSPSPSPTPTASPTSANPTPTPTPSSTSPTSP